MFGMSVFQSVLERLKTEQSLLGDVEAGGDETACEGPGSPIGRSKAFVVETPARTTAPFAAVERAYLDLASAERSEEPFVMPDHLQRTSLTDVAAELDLGEGETGLTLAAKRRRFAAANHPDRLPPEFRLNATIRMKLANMLIDEALRRLGQAAN
ncbi:hypothetical protein [Sinorhizobium americanum]|uniref:Uncharacterized protein n=1 Tax=Sinorhizobium americanum TaxID=194963 RepID=A0A1L3LPL5_9HYPH|nr:hypothetical protein [Sinorhizobium americanum]APG85370.1 hypothetical protein SAMCCGM7_Ch2632 [Sinorhizobium americanum CCGM7]APG92029.1 hypothetical protein SAMCFNEI73_Ch2754 [Sinorhizobium americanum]OAP34811.1 hypothetical protein ATC00_15945 [Sinorhizobium americanum]